MEIRETKISRKGLLNNKYDVLQGNLKNPPILDGSAFVMGPFWLIKLLCTIQYTASILIRYSYSIRLPNKKVKYGIEN